MLLAIREARKNLKTMHGGPFGACIVKNGQVLAVARNTVLRQDATCHAEINAIRIASSKIKSYNLSGCQIYSTTEPCPMCFGAIHWSKIDTLIYGTSIQDAKRLGFNELRIPCRKMKSHGRSKMAIFSGFMREGCLDLFKDWADLEGRVVY
jgi:guanine deaminase